ncbi:MAG: enoyl-CoA hydratase/isomerase family protein [Nanoarchaeota archaeon]|nr:enoyl-CoA hydratase/isomerase family protein [Nanoarchaeota archaeon]
MGYVEVKIKEDIAFVSIKRPRGNLINRTLLRDLNKALSKIDVSVIKGLIITGSGSTFSNGGDLKEVARLTCNNAKDFSKLGQETFLQLSRIDRPCIAAINGTAIGPGLELALACDIRLATPNAVFQHPEKAIGLYPCFGGSVRLTKIIGRAAANKLINSSRRLTAAEAHQEGLIDYIVDEKNLLFEAQRAIHTDEVSKPKFRKEDFMEEREAFARCFSDIDLRRKLRKIAKI